MRFLQCQIDNIPEIVLLGIDLKKFGRRDAFLRVIATMLGLDLDNFISWEARERRKRITIYTSAAAVLAVILCQTYPSPSSV